MQFGNSEASRRREEVKIYPRKLSAAIDAKDVERHIIDIPANGYTAVQGPGFFRYPPRFLGLLRVFKDEENNCFQLVGANLKPLPNTSEDDDFCSSSDYAVLCSSNPSFETSTLPADIKTLRFYDPEQTISIYGYDKSPLAPTDDNEQPVMECFAIHITHPKDYGLLKGILELKSLSVYRETVAKVRSTVPTAEGEYDDTAKSVQ